MSKIRDLTEFNFWLGNQSKRSYFAIMQNKRYLPKDTESIQKELDRARRNVAEQTGPFN